MINRDKQRLKVIAILKILQILWVRGGLIGLALAVLVACASFFGLSGKIGLQWMTNFFSSLPIFATTIIWHDGPDIFGAIIFFTYWISVGSLAGWGFGKGKIGKLLVGLSIILLLSGHLKAKMILERELEGAAKAFQLFILEIWKSFNR